MAYLTIGDYRLYYEDFPPRTAGTSKHPVVFLHGFTLDHRLWSGDAAHFSRSYRVLVLDSKGHGLSDTPPTGYSRDDRVEDLVSLVNNLGINKAHIVGLSMGGSTAIGLALKYSERMASMTLVSTGAAGFDVGPKIRGIDRLAREKGIESARDKWLRVSLMWYKKDKKHIRDLVEKMIREHSGAVWKDPMRGRYPRRYDLDDAHRITVPTLILAGRLDKIFLELSRKLHERIPGSRLSVFESVGHVLNLEAPDRFRKQLESFLETVEANGD
ncbi:MAG: alpha/beta fold hydrolase [Candidatus Zixiibacteriota bacterium]|nr:MAG: alpha/beta fold hydrolase [candidate division Zixibacteria bacterium]